MDALDEVKQEIQKKRVIKRRQAEVEYNRQMRQAIFSKNKPIPPVKSFRNPATQKPFSLEVEEVGDDQDEDKIDIKDLKWEDKEKLLRVLFAKMNGLALVQSYESIGPEEDPRSKEIRSYRGAEYPIGPAAFSGSLANRVDRISNIDQSGDLYVDENEQNITSKPRNASEELDAEDGQMSDVPLFSVPIITMEEELGPPVFIIEDQ